MYHCAGGGGGGGRTMLPNLAGLGLCPHKCAPADAEAMAEAGRATGVLCEAADLREVKAEWLAATGKSWLTSKSWDRFTALDKMRLVHLVAQRAQTAKRGYLTPYLEVDIDDIMYQQRWSVEHVMPRSKCQMAQGDPWNFVEADRAENSARGNLPLKLWPDNSNQLQTSKFQTWDGEVHYAPPENQRARLARKWLYTRATYGCTPMSRAQKTHLHAIIALAKRIPPDKIELNVAKQLEILTGTRNPLILDTTPEHWYDSPAWRAMIRCGV
jgi:hypothetical protein